MSQEELILLAKIRKAHGVKGEVILQTFTMDDNRFKKLKRVFLRNDRGIITEQQIGSVRMTNNGVLMKFDGVDDRNGADALQFQEVLIPISERQKLPEGHAYYDEIIGMDVIDDESEEKLGVIRDIMEMPAGEVYVIKKLDGTEHLLSSVGEEVKKLDTKKNTLRVKLLEEY
ncbi:MAG TPA: ribosome maturation factor RimM [Candidatus Kapabacteria bacterium]|nr:ribosome maturation factor RimM [Candidatus Kapabacteria bacterium]